jgi:small-conductance mechanosensitive channel
MRVFALLLTLLTVLPLAPVSAQTATGPAPAAAPAQPALSPAQAQQVLDVLQDEKKRQAFTAVLEDIIRGLPAAPATPTKKPVVQIAANNLGAELVLQVSRGVQNLTGQFSAAADAVNDLPLVYAWLIGLVEDPTARASVGDALWRLAVVLAAAAAGEWLMSRALAKPRRVLDARAPADTPDPVAPALVNGAVLDPEPAPAQQHSLMDDPGPDGMPEEAGDESAGRVHGRRLSTAWKMLRRLPFVLVNLVLNVLPVAVFAALGNVLLSTPLGDTRNTRLVVIAVVNAYVMCRLVMCLVRMMVAPDAPRLRLIQCTDDTAQYIERWMRRLSAVAVFGFALAGVGLLFGLYGSAHDVVIKAVALVVHVMLIIIVLQKRRAVEHRLRARRRASGAIATLQNQLAARWHLVAIFYIVALWLVAAAEIRDGYTRLLHFFVVSTGVVIAARLVSILMLGGLDRGLHALGKSAPGLEPRIIRYEPALRYSLSAVLFAATFLALLDAWGFSPFGWFTADRLGGQVLSALATSAVTIMLAAVIWEAANASVENHLAGLARQAQMARAARLRTLLPMLRTALMVSILIIAGLIVLSQVGVNIAPLLAGAGVLGVAIGFGSQKLVQDLITGLFLLLENTMQVGDVVALGGLTGRVENLSIRTIRLRALDGSVHIIPFSSVTTVTNQTRDYSYALLDVQVGLNEEPDHVADVLRSIVQAMRDEPRWQDAITADLEVMGVNAFSDNAWTLRVRIKTQPSERWAVSREFNRRLKYTFDKLAIQSPITSWQAQGWLPPGSERPIPQPSPEPPAGAAAAPQEHPAEPEAQTAKAAQ